MKTMVVSTVLAVGVALLSCGCGIKEDKATAEKVATDLLESIKASDFDKAVTFYSPRFFQEIPKDEWQSILENLTNKLGALQSYELVSWRFSKQASAVGAGTYCLLQYKVTYAKYPATEALTVFKPIGGEYRILAHNISSLGLLKE